MLPDSLCTLLDKLECEHALSRDEWERLISDRTPDLAEDMKSRACALRDERYGKRVFKRGLIEFTNYCKNDCLYCGIRRSNKCVNRYRLSGEEILQCCEQGYDLGFRTFVLQGGEDPYYDDARMVSIVSSIREAYPGCAITLSIGERSEESYRALRAAGADRYLLRHETADPHHYDLLHPNEMSLTSRKKCLMVLRSLGYQVGSGFMVGSPGQTARCLAEVMVFLQELQPHMIGIGPFVPHKDTPFARESQGTLELTLFMLSALRMAFPDALIPATTALGTIASDGREQGILAGANVVMPNLSPVAHRKDYSLYDNKICTGEEAAECRWCLDMRMDRIGYRIVEDRGDSLVK